MLCDFVKIFELKEYLSYKKISIKKMKSCKKPSGEMSRGKQIKINRCCKCRNASNILDGFTF